MKKISTFILATVMVMTLSQCKKNEQNTTADKGVAITLNVIDDNDNTNDSNTRVDVNTMTGTVDFEENDQILVASGGKYVGTLTYNGNLFTGSVYNAVAGYPLRFYFLGNITPAETLTYGETETCSVVITDQTEHLPVVSYAPSNENYGTTTDFTSHLLNKCALVKFNVTSASEAATCITGFNNKVTVNFSESTLTPSQEGNGVITLPAGTGERWAILLPQAALAAGGAGSAYSADNAYTGTRGAVPAIGYNAFLTAGIPVMLEAGGGGGGGGSNAPVGAINGLFTINANGDQVYFSQGNLQYQASSNTWHFAENQYDLIITPEDMTSIDNYGNYYADVSSQYTSMYDGWIDLFGWGTSSYNHGAACYQPWSTSKTYSNYYAYGQYIYNLYNQSGMADWGYNAIANGGNMENFGWRTLTRDEWNYVFISRTNASSKYGHGKVNGVNGMILLPDEWTQPDELNFISGNSDWTNVYTIEQWALMEGNGAIFLPAAGTRSGTSVFSVGTHSLYLTATVDPQQYSNGYGQAVYCLHCSSDSFYMSTCARYAGRSVRLVRNAQ